MTATCTICAQPLGDTAYVCSPCVGTLTAALRAVHGDAHLHGLDADLDIALAKQAVFPRQPGGRSRSAEAPLPLNLNAAEAAAVLRSTLVGWVRVLLGEDGAPLPADTLSGTARWLEARVETVRHREWASECVDEVLAAVHQARRAVDRPAEWVYVGQCPQCGGRVFGGVDREAARCRAEGCDGEITDAEGHRQQRYRAAAQAAPDRAVTAAEGAMAARALGRPITERWIRKLAAAGRLEQVSAKRPARYRLGDIMDIADKTEKRTA
ncbi:hypothetical protein [Nocardiopsis composta]|uniref:Uncharacterized protein n=1 Tax=Nocardiopsis composta TaxID=157465 RepID=A0A7W8VCV2_9ACTN|nr:hypothetical protein [Nocardiopsis composta]MBB5431365.1 hypothetical protein [Nocardiopsis composta]